MLVGGDSVCVCSCGEGVASRRWPHLRNDLLSYAHAQWVRESNLK